MNPVTIESVWLALCDNASMKARESVWLPTRANPTLALVVGSVQADLELRVR